MTSPASRVERAGRTERVSTCATEAADDDDDDDDVDDDDDEVPAAESSPPMARAGCGLLHWLGGGRGVSYPSGLCMLCAAYLLLLACILSHVSTKYYA